MPATYGECERRPRPCPFIRCRHHLFLETIRHGGQRKSGQVALEEMEETCALDAAKKNGSMTRKEVGRLMNISAERVRQLENEAVEKLKQVCDLETFNDLEDDYEQFMPSLADWFEVRIAETATKCTQDESCCPCDSPA